MTTKRRRRFTADFKKRVALEALRGDRTVQAIAAKHEVHPNQVGTWKRQAVEGLDEVFARGGSPGPSEHEATIRDLHAKIRQSGALRTHRTRGSPDLRARDRRVSASERRRVVVGDRSPSPASLQPAMTMVFGVVVHHVLQRRHRRRHRQSRSAASSAASASRTSLAGQSNRAASRRAIAPHRGGRRFDGLVSGQASHPRTNRSPFSGR